MLLIVTLQDYSMVPEVILQQKENCPWSLVRRRHDLSLLTSMPGVAHTRL